MSLKALQGRYPCSKELEEAKQQIEQLERELTAFKAKGSANAPAYNEQPILTQLRNELHIVMKRADNAESTLTNTINKNERIEKELNQERKTNHDLSSKVLATEKQMRQTQSPPGLDPASTSREVELRKLVEKFKTENARLHRQLQAEKTENTSRLGWKQRDNCGQSFDQDDDEDVHRASTMSTASSRGLSFPTRPATAYRTPAPTPPPTFKSPTALQKIAEWDPRLLEQDDLSSGDEMNTKQQDTVVKKRERTEQEEIENELPGLRLNHFVAPTGPRKKKRTHLASNNIGTGEFSYRAVYSYNSKGTPIIYPSNTFEKRQGVRDDRIRETIEIWEQKKGLAWLFDFTRTDYKPIIPPCVTMKIAGRRTKWRQDGVGKYACRTCVEMGRPCFTWVEREEKQKGGGWSLWEFRLLPLYPLDRKNVVGKGKEVGYWVNEETAFQVGDVIELDEDDYID